MSGVPVADDPALPTLAAALDPGVVGPALASLPALDGAGPLVAIRVVRHKPGRRCVVAYDLADYGRVYGKLRRHRSGASAYRLLQALRAAGLDGAGHGIAVPEPVGHVRELRLWLQREAPGREATELVEGAVGLRVAGRVAEAADELHRAGVPASRRHGVADELLILRERLCDVAVEEPSLGPRLGRLYVACERAGAGLVGHPERGIHRDFYADQVLVAGDRLTLVDFDLYCIGDPALDIGNYLGHVTELALRRTGSAAAYAPVEAELLGSFARRAGGDAARRARAWAALTVARHVFLSTRIAGRGHTTLPLIELAERRLAEAAA
ncbi:MAG: phosphotransferase [Thermoleophilia bacterium]